MHCYFRGKGHLEGKVVDEIRFTDHLLAFHHPQMICNV